MQELRFETGPGQQGTGGESGFYSYCSLLFFAEPELRLAAVRRSAQQEASDTSGCACMASPYCFIGELLQRLTLIHRDP